MTNEEAMIRIKKHNKIYSKREPFYKVYMVEAFEMAVKALEKQIPKKVTLVSKNDYHIVYCPRCGFRFFQYGLLFCGECGQALDWSDING